MATTTIAFEAELIAGGYPLRQRGLMAGACFKLRENYQRGMVDPAAHVAAKANPEQLGALTANSKLVSFDAITAP